jgi:hypothetical protein
MNGVACHPHVGHVTRVLHQAPRIHRAGVRFDRGDLSRAGLLTAMTAAAPDAAAVPLMGAS